jgi:hypothetical protein
MADAPGGAATPPTQHTRGVSMTSGPGGSLRRFVVETRDDGPKAAVDQLDDVRELARIR